MLTGQRLKEIQVLEALASKGPWRWEGNAKYCDVYLGSRLNTVMTFERWGMRRAAPTFVVDGIITHSKQLVQFEVGDPNIVGIHTKDPSRYRGDICGIAHPDAQFIAESRQMVSELLQEVIDLRRKHERFD